MGLNQYLLPDEMLSMRSADVDIPVVLMAWYMSLILIRSRLLFLNFYRRIRIRFC